MFNYASNARIISRYECSAMFINELSQGHKMVPLDRTNIL